MATLFLDAPTDPIEGGSANNYDYVSGDPVNGFDLAGTICWSCAGRHLRNASRKVGKAALHVASNQYFQLGVSALACGFAPGIGCAVANFGFAALNAGNRFATKGWNRDTRMAAFYDFGFAGLKSFGLRPLSRTPVPGLGFRLSASALNGLIFAGYNGLRSGINRVSGLPQ